MLAVTLPTFLMAALVLGCLIFGAVILLLGFGLAYMADDGDDFDGGFGEDYPPEWRTRSDDKPPHDVRHQP